jgi:hypothetical protein
MGFNGRVTGTVKRGTVGEVVISIRGGTEFFLAYPAREDQVIAVGESVLVVEYHPPRVVIVTPWVDVLNFS